MERDNRESWLNRVASGMAPLFEALDTPRGPMHHDPLDGDEGGEPDDNR